jgi:hypothetical protein
MGLFKLLTFPISVPVAGGTWVLQTLLEEAERRYYDEAAIRQALADVAQRYEAGEIGRSAFDEEEEQLLTRLLEARDYHRRKWQPPGSG